MVLVRRKRPRDVIQRAKMIVDIATGELSDFVEDGRNPAAVELGRSGGLAGGRTRAARLTPAQRSELARKAALARWSKRK